MLGTEGEAVQLSGYLVILRRWVWTLLIAVWAAALAGYLIGSWMPPTYEAQTKMLVGPISGNFDTLRASGQLVQTYAEYQESTTLLSATIKELGLAVTPDELAGAVRATPDDVTRFLTVRVQYGDPDMAAKIANSLAQGLIEATSQSPTRPEGEVTVTQPAVPPTEPIAPDTALIVLVAAVAGLGTAILLVVVVETLADTVRSPQDVARLARTEVLGTVPSTYGENRLVPVVGTAASRAYHALAATLALRLGEGGGRSVAIASVEASHGGLEVAAGLAAAMTDLAARAVLVDVVGDLPDDQSLSGLDRLDIERWADSDRSAPTDMKAIEGRIATLHKRDAVILVHTGPAGDPGTLVWAHSSRGTVITLIKDRTRRSAVSAAVAELARVDARVIGAIMVEEVGRGSARRRRTALAEWSSTRLARTLHPTEHATDEEAAHVSRTPPPSAAPTVPAAPEGADRPRRTAAKPAAAPPSLHEPQAAADEPGG